MKITCPLQMFLQFRIVLKGVIFFVWFSKAVFLHSLQFDNSINNAKIKVSHFEVNLWIIRKKKPLPQFIYPTDALNRILKHRLGAQIIHLLLTAIIIPDWIHPVRLIYILTFGWEGNDFWELKRINSASHCNQLLSTCLHLLNHLIQKKML